MFELLDGCLPNDHSRQISYEYYLKLAADKQQKIERVVDLGCGAGGSVDQFRAINPSIKWVGLDIQESPEVRYRVRNDPEFHLFHGGNIPFNFDPIDLVYSKHVLDA